MTPEERYVGIDVSKKHLDVLSRIPMVYVEIAATT